MSAQRAQYPFFSYEIRELRKLSKAIVSRGKARDNNDVAQDSHIHDKQYKHPAISLQINSISMKSRVTKSTDP